MRHLKLLGLALMVILAVIVVLTNSAFALNLPVNLPESTTRTWVGKNVGEPAFLAEGLAHVVCKAAKSEGTETSSDPPLGLFHISFEECATVGFLPMKCTGLGEAAGVILALGTWHLVWDRVKGGSFELSDSAILFLNEAVHFSCTVVLIEVQAGETLCLHLSPTESKATHEFHCVGTENAGGTPEPTEEWCAADPCVAPKTPSLTSKINMAAVAVPSVQEGLGTITALEGGAEKAIFADQ